MRKIAVFLLSLMVAVIVLSSCKSSERCAAYGETQKFQKEKRK